MSGENLTDLEMNTLLNHFTTHYVQLRHEEKKEASSSWKPIVKVILDYVGERNDDFASLERIFCGSSYEGTKVGEPDEFDVMLVMKNAVFREVSELPGVNTPPTGGLNWIGIRILNDSGISPRSPTCIPSSELEELSAVQACV